MSQRDHRTTGGPVGRPSKFTPETRSKLLAAIRAGNYISVACRYAGVGYRTWYDWRAYATSLHERVDVAEEPETELASLTEEERSYYDWWTDVCAAEDEAEVRLVTQWASAASEDWRAARDLLARRHPDRWKERREDALVGEDGGAVQVKDVTTRQLDADHLAGVVEALRELGIV